VLGQRRVGDAMVCDCVVVDPGREGQVVSGLVMMRWRLGTGMQDEGSELTVNIV
jgi:hypothetical protein